MCTWIRQDEHCRRRSVIAVLFRRQMIQRFESATAWGLGPQRCLSNKPSAAVSERQDDVRRRNDLRWSVEASPVVADAMVAAPRLPPTIGVRRELSAALPAAMMAEAPSRTSAACRSTQSGRACTSTSGRVGVSTVIGSSFGRCRGVTSPLMGSVSACADGPRWCGREPSLHRHIPTPWTLCGS